MLNIREIEVFRPYANEVPEELLLAEGFSQAELDTWLQAEMLRVAKRNDEVLGVYAMDPKENLVFHLHGVIVAQRWRRQGVGRWLVGHAIGVAESKGARHVQVSNPKVMRFWRSLDFLPDGDSVRFDLIPE